MNMFNASVLLKKKTLVVIMKNFSRQLVVVACCVIFLSSCFKPYDNLNRQVLADEQLEIENTAAEMRTWGTNDLTLRYNALDSGDAITFTGFVKISNSVTYSFPRADFLILYVYLLNQDGMSTSRHIIRPSISRYNTFSRESRFGKTIRKDPGTTSFAFGYWGNFVDSESTFRGGRFGSEGDEWEIYYSPFEKEPN
jgi:hypothetical protein